MLSLQIALQPAEFPHSSPSLSLSLFKFRNQINFISLPFTNLNPKKTSKLSLNNNTKKKEKPTMEKNFSSLPLLLLLSCALILIVPQVSATRYIVGGKYGWQSNPNNVNYTVWAKEHKFYLGDWLFFVYDRNQNNVLEVNKTNYDSCNAEHFVHNWTTGAGRDVVPLNVSRHYYFISGNGFCYGGMKVAVLVTKPPPPPTSAPAKSASPSQYGTQILTRVALAVGVVWTLLLQAW